MGIPVARICFKLLDKQGRYRKAWNGIITLQECCLWDIHLGFYQMRVPDIIALRSLQHYISHIFLDPIDLPSGARVAIYAVPVFEASYCDQDKAPLKQELP